MATRELMARSTRLAMAAAGAAVAVLAAAQPTMAQYRVGADGHANDANTRIGSGGYNSASDLSYRSNLSTQLITGNTSGLSYFHGQTGTFDPSVIQANTQDNGFQNFTRNSAPANYAARNTGAPTYTPYYNTQTYVGQPPANYTPTANGVGLIPQQTRSPLTPDPGDARLQQWNNAPLDMNSTNLPTPGSLNQPGPVNNVGNAAGIYSSSLYGPRAMQFGDDSSSLYGAQKGGALRPGGMPQMSVGAIRQMQDELRVSATPQKNDLAIKADLNNSDQSGNGPNANGVNGANGANALPGGNGSLNGAANPGGVPNGTGGSSTVGGQMSADATKVSGTQVTGSRISGTSLNGQQVPSSLNAAYGGQQNTLMLAPAQQSRQIQELERRFAANNPNPTAAQQANQNNRIILALRKAEADKKAALAKNAAGGGDAAGADKKSPDGLAGGDKIPGSVGGGGIGVGNGVTGTVPAPTGKGGVATTEHPEPAGGGKPLPPVIRDDAGGNADQPFVITSLATGVKATGLAKLLRDAEGQMRAGQFSQSVDTYDTASQVAPNNPFVALGRAFAELGASYYGKAEADLTRAIDGEPALLAAQYDLKGFLGADRLKFVQKDLADIGSTEQAARPFLLLAYIDHNTGADDTTVTAKDLDTAQARGANPKLIDLMRTAWNIKPAVPAAPDMNK